MNVSPNQIRLHVNDDSPRAEQGGPWDVAAILDVLRRRRRLALSLLLVCLASAVVYLATATPLFTATSVLVIDTKMTPPSPAQASSDPTVDPAVVESQIEILKSQKIATDVVDRLGLQNDPEFVGEGPSLLGQLMTLVEFSSGPSASPNLRQVAAGALERKLKITRTGRSFLAEVNATTRDARKSAAIANAVGEAYIQDQLNSRLEISQRTTDWMQQRLQDVRNQAEAADRALKDFRANVGSGAVHAGAVDLAWERTAIEAMQHSAADNLDKARTSLAAAQSALAALESGNAAAVTWAQLDAVVDPETSRLATKISSRGTSPAQSEALRGRLKALVEERRNAVGLAERRADLLSRRLNDLAQRNEAGASDGHERQLERAAEAARTTYESLQNRVMRVSAFLQQQALPVTEARVVSAAVPPLAKSSPKITLVLLLTAAGGLTAGVAGAFLREMFDRRVCWPAQITRLGQPFLGSLPTVKGRRLRAPGGPLRRACSVPLLISGRRASAVALETLRSAKLALDQALGRERCRVVGIISACNREGKSTVATNFAVLAAETGARVLLVDADLHGGGLSALFAGDGRIGLVEALIERQPLAHYVVQTSLGFDFLPGAPGKRPAHPTEILASAGLRQFLMKVRESYDYVVIDVPAVLCSVDARAIADALDGFILTLSSGSTTLDAIESVFTACPGIADRIIGVILNRSKTVIHPPRPRPRQIALEIVR